ncbi:MAG TPA: LysR substrate-binding domain-containing protein [Methylomirabilota bacterium]|nr:LysR substrate-binding domain-containing protein [Methylomirabilota bacterium]
MTAFEDMRLLRSFVRIAESGSISAAARAMNTSQPTVSRQLSQLEQDAGVVLLRRDTHTMSLTAAGHRLLEDARRILNMAEAAAERVREDKEAPQGHLRLVAVLDSGQWLLPRALAKFRERYPRVTAELHLTNRPSKFAEEGFDCGLLVGPITDTSLATRKLGLMTRSLVAAPALLARTGVPKSPSDLRSLPYLGILQPHFFSRDRVSLVRKGQPRSVRLSPVLVLDGMTALREAAIAGAGMTSSPDWLIADAVRRGELVKLLPGWEVSPAGVHIVFPTGHLPSRVRALIDFLAEEIPAMLEGSSLKRA